MEIFFKNYFWLISHWFKLFIYNLLFPLFRRGPNKYTRNWEDEDAYGKTAASVTSGKTPGPRRTNRSGEAFPALGGGNQVDLREFLRNPQNFENFRK